MVGMKASCKDYKEINELNQMLCWLKNKEMVFEYWTYDKDTDDYFPETSQEEVEEIIKIIENKLKNLFNFHKNFGDTLSLDKKLSCEKN